MPAAARLRRKNMTITLLIIIIALLAHFDYQFWKVFIEPKLKHEKIRLQEVLEDYDKIIAERAAKAAEAIK